MEGLMVVLTTLACIAVAVGTERMAVRGLRAAWLAHEPLSGEHTDSVLYHRSLWTPGAADVAAMQAALLASGLLLAGALQLRGGLAWPALFAWLAVLAWDLWSWELVAGSVKFVSWRRGWQQSARRVAVSELREVNVVERRFVWKRLPAWLQLPKCYLVLIMHDGKAVKLPKTGGLFGGEADVETLANFVRMQMDVVADNRRRAVADKRSAARQARLPRQPLQPLAPLQTVGAAEPQLKAARETTHRGDLW